MTSLSMYSQEPEFPSIEVDEADTSALYEGERSDDSEDAIPEHEIYSTQDGSRRRRTLMLGGLLCLCGLVLIVVLSVVLTQDSGDGSNNTSVDRATTVDGAALGLEGIDEPGSYQNAAYTWLTNDVADKTLDDEQLIQRYAVATLYYATSSTPTPGTWNSASEWLTSANECSWEGVTCSGSKVTSLQLAGNGLTGPLPKELALLEDLFLLDLGGNDLTGAIPEELGGLEKLIFLDLEECALSGPIPKTLGGLGRLQQLLLNDNPSIVGPVPEEFGALDNLYMLKLQGTDLIGSMPQSVCSLFQQGSLTVPRTLSANCRKLRCNCCTDCV